jgi:hypothetical protein
MILLGILKDYKFKMENKDDIEKPSEINKPKMHFR